MINLHDKVAVITGGKGQLGTVISNKFRDLGATVYDLDISDGFDLKDKPNVFKTYNKIFNTHKQVDILINNAGVSVFDDAMERTETDLDYVYNVNLKGTFNSIQSFVKCYDKNKQKIGSIINIGSLYGIVSPDFKIYGNNDRKNSEIYGATKAGIIQMTKYFAVYFYRNT